MVFRGYIEGMIDLPVFACPRSLFKRGKVGVVLLEAVEGIISAFVAAEREGKDLMLEVCSRLGRGLPI